MRYYAIKIIEWLASFACFASIACFIISFSGSFFLNSDKWHNTLMVMCNRITWGRLLLSLASCTPSFFPFWWFSWLFASFPSLAMQFLIQEKQLPFYTKNSFKTACLKILLKINQPHFKNNAWFMTTWHIEKTNSKGTVVENNRKCLGYELRLHF